MGDFGLALRLARREMRGGLRGFRIFLACLVLGVAAIAAVGITRAAIHGGLTAQGRVLLGGDAALKFTYRTATNEERAFMADVAMTVAEVIEFRSMVVIGDGATAERALTEVKAIDDHWPLLGTVELEPPQDLAAALAPVDGVPGGVMDPVLADRLGLVPGDRFQLGTQEFHLGALLRREPDSAAGGFGLGPRSLVRTADLAASGLLGAGTLFTSSYRLMLPDGTDLDRLKARAQGRFGDAGLRWQDRRHASPGIDRFIERLGDFLVLLGLAGLAIGGIGVAAAVRAYLAGKVATIATLRVLGAQQRLIMQVYLFQIGALALLGVGLGLALGVVAPLALAPVLNAALPVPAVFAPYPRPLAEAAFYGLMVAALFTVWPLARTAGVRAATLYRAPAGTAPGWPAPGWWLATAALAALLIGGAALLSGQPLVALAAAGGTLGVLLALLGVARGLRALARRLAHWRVLHGRPVLRLALAAVGGPGGEVTATVAALGLGLTVLAAVGQVDANLRRAIANDLPARAPAFFFVDIQPDQLAEFHDRLAADASVTRIETAPMLRGILSRINGQVASQVAGEHWVVRGDRGVSYAATAPEGTEITAGRWWPAGHTGPPEVSFAANEARELGLKLGDTIGVNILGREITATITSFRAVDFTGGGIGFVMIFSPDAMAGAPHTAIATVYNGPEADGRILRDIGQTFPNITAISIRAAAAEALAALETIATATAWAAGITLATGVLVLIGAAAAGEPARIYEAAVLKVLGATRGRILTAFALRSALMGAAAGAVAVLAGAGAAAAVLRLMMRLPWHFAPGPALVVIIGGLVAVLLAGALFARRPLAARPARILRGAE